MKMKFKLMAWCALSLLALQSAACDGTARRETMPGEVSNLPPGVPPPAEPLPEPIENLGPCALQITEVALYQAVKIPLAVTDAAAGALVASGRTADVVLGRPALIRAFATPTADWQGIATARLTLTSAQGTKVFDATNDLRRGSNDLAFDSTFNFQLPGEAIASDTAWRVDVISPGTCAKVAGVRFPAENVMALGPRKTGVVKVTLVPVQFDSDQSGRLPDVSDPQIQRYRDLVMSMYPVTAAELTVREPVRTDLKITSQNGWEDLLDALRMLRQEDGAPPDVHYYGIINPASSFSVYCGRACTAGIAYVSKDRQAALRVGVGVGFTGQFAAQTFAHELGHQHGRLHSPCNVDGDSQYPYSMGGVGVWGYDRSSNRLIDPSGFSDIMGYCSPQWISDFTYQGLLEHLALLQSVPSVQALRVQTTWNVLLVSGDGSTRWGHPLTTAEAPAGVAEVAQVYDDLGQQVATPTVYRNQIADSDTSMLWVPQAEPGWASVAVAGASAAHRFDAPVAGARLR